MKNNINIPSEKLNESILKGIEKGRQEKPMKSKNNSTTIKRVASIVIIGGIGIGLTFPIMAQAMTSIEDAIKGFLEIALPDRYSEELKDEKNSNNMVVSNDKGTVTLESSVLDSNIFIANLTLESDFLKQYNETDLKYSLYSSIHIAIGDEDNLVGGGGTIKKIDDTKASVVVTANVGDLNIENNTDIYIKFEGVSIESNEWKSDDKRNLEGNWRFEYNLDKVDSIKNINVNDEIQIDENTMTLENIEITPLATYIEITVDEEMRDTYNGTYITHKGRWPSNTHWNDTKQIDYMSGETEFIIDKIDKNKKYKLAVPLQKQINLNPDYTMKVNLN